MPGRFPLWKWNAKAKLIMLNSNISFASDMRVILKRKAEQSYFGNVKDPPIGQFLVPVESIMTLHTLPQYYNVIDPEGNIKGKILARFFLLKKTQDTTE